MKNDIKRPFWLTRLPENKPGLYFMGLSKEGKNIFEDISYRGFKLTNSFRIQYAKQKKSV